MTIPFERTRALNHRRRVEDLVSKKMGWPGSTLQRAVHTRVQRPRLEVHVFPWGDLVRFRNLFRLLSRPRPLRMHPPQLVEYVMSNQTGTHEAQACIKNECRNNFQPDGGPFSLARIQAQARAQHALVDTEALTAQLRARELAVIELFAVLCRHSPELLPPAWGALYDLICAEERFWIFPRVTVGALEDGDADMFAPYLDVKKIKDEWENLLEHARKVISTRRSGQCLSLPS